MATKNVQTLPGVKMTAVTKQVTEHVPTLPAMTEKGATATVAAHPYKYTRGGYHTIVKFDRPWCGVTELDAAFDGKLGTVQLWTVKRGQDGFKVHHDSTALDLTDTLRRLGWQVTRGDWEDEPTK